jgi:hypothetical protein
MDAHSVQIVGATNRAQHRHQAGRHELARGDIPVSVAHGEGHDARRSHRQDVGFVDVIGTSDNQIARTLRASAHVQHVWNSWY